LLGELAASTEPLTQKLNAETAKAAKIDRIDVSEKSFRWLMNEDPSNT